MDLPNAPDHQRRRHKNNMMPSSFDHIKHKFMLYINRNVSLKKAFIILGSVTILLYIYHSLLYTYGTVAPPAVWYYTAPFSSGLASNDYPPPKWVPPFRVVVSLTTTPNRMHTVSDSVQSLLAQSLVPDVIYLNIPTGPMKRHPERTYDDNFTLGDDIGHNPRVRVLRPIDYGPATKLIPALQHEDDGDTLIITVDDDFIYHPRVVEALAWEAFNNNEDVALGVCGWGMMPFGTGTIGIIPVYVPYVLRPKGRLVDILQACCGNAYRRNFFEENLETLIDMPEVCVTVDDVWISGYLAARRNVRRAIISKRLDPSDPEWKIAEAQDVSASKMKLSSFNDANEIHIKCVEALEQVLGVHWKRVYE